MGVQARGPGNPHRNVAADLTRLRGKHNFKVGFRCSDLAPGQKNQFES
jgi:hypothetical protein